MTYKTDDDIGGADFTLYHSTANGFFAGVTVTVIIVLVMGLL